MNFDFNNRKFTVDEISCEYDGTMSVSGTCYPTYTKPNEITITQYRPFGHAEDLMLAFCDDKLPKKYIINDNATILIWEDNTKTIIKRNPEDKFDPKLAFLIAYFQKHCGLSKTKANEYLEDLEPVKINKLKIGDRVKIISKSGYIKHCFDIGTIGRIIEIDGNTYNVIDDSDCEQWVNYENIQKM